MRDLAELLIERGLVELTLERSAIGHLEIDGALDDVPARFLIDTGASSTVIDRASAEARSLTRETSNERAAGLGTIGQATEATEARLRLGSLDLGRVKVAVLDLSHVNAALAQHGAGAIDGVIGNDLLIARQAILDVVGARLYLLPP